MLTEFVRKICGQVHTKTITVQVGFEKKKSFKEHSFSLGHAHFRFKSEYWHKYLEHFTDTDRCIVLHLYSQDIFGVLLLPIKL